MNINPFELLKNAQKIQEQMGSFQEKLADISVQGSAGGGMVEVELSGKLEVIAVRIAPEAIEGGDTEMLADLVTAAFSNALEKIKEALRQEIGTMAGGIPGISGLMGAL
ncbi:MAG: YbaB/EbfC family nucleoid-associated protein [Treponema sp.]|jgi:DNA-binding YbaB/EbfC family protein|nr:YbaB/EbfC family nucleoid-associated protein [Treponema sp.]